MDPKVGLSLYGPLKAWGADHPAPYSIKAGIVGTSATVTDSNRWLERINAGPIRSKADPFQTQSFPGFKKVFGCDLVKGDEYNHIISATEVAEIPRLPTFDDRVEWAVDLFSKAIENVSSGTFKPDVVICALPEEVINYCVVRQRGASRPSQKLPPKQLELVQKLLDYERTGQQFLFEGFKSEAQRILSSTVRESTNFWRQLKARSMRIPMPTQIMWPQTLSQSGLARQDDATVAWNSAVAIYYKGSGFPWTMTRMQLGTCYVGVSFFKEPSFPQGRLRTSMAQIFTYTGEGLVLRGDSFDWDPTFERNPHLSEILAERLINRVLELYLRRIGHQPTRVVIHKSSQFWPEELRGFGRALEIVPKKDFVSFGDKGIKFYRFGKYPPLRGTAIQVAEHNYLLYARGYIPYLRTYPGARVPWPLDIIHTGDSPSDTILSEILALTKMNWNSAEFALDKPVTLVFSEKVGEVMASLPETTEPRHEYHYYM